MRIAIATLLMGLCVCTTRGDELVRDLQKIPLPNVEGRIDHMSLCGDRLYVAAVGNNSLEVVDLSNGKIVQSVKDLPEAQGVRCSAAMKRIFVGTGGDGACHIFDSQALKPVKTVALGDDADNVRLDESAKRVYVGYGEGAIAVLEAETGDRLADIKLPGHPESFQLTADGKRIFVNIPSAKLIAVIDVSAAKVITTWPVTEAAANFPMALDEAHHRLFTVCRKPAKLLVYDTQTGKLVSAIDCCGDADDVFYDEKSNCILISGGDGNIDVLRPKDADHYERIQRLPTAAGARTSLWSSTTRRLYVAIPHRGGQPAEIRVYQMTQP